MKFRVMLCLKLKIVKSPSYIDKDWTLYILMNKYFREVLLNV